MIKLKNIRIDGSELTCAAFVEDCPEAINVSLGVVTDTFHHDPLPIAYSWCKHHMRQAEKALRHMTKTGNVFKEKTIMWY